MPCVSVVVSGDFCRFKLALPSLLSMSKDMTYLLKVITVMVKPQAAQAHVSRKSQR